MKTTTTNKSKLLLIAVVAIVLSIVVNSCYWSSANASNDNSISNDIDKENPLQSWNAIVDGQQQFELKLTKDSPLYSYIMPDTDNFEFAHKGVRSNAESIKDLVLALANNQEDIYRLQLQYDSVFSGDNCNRSYRVAYKIKTCDPSDNLEWEGYINFSDTGSHHNTIERQVPKTLTDKNNHRTILETYINENCQNKNLFEAVHDGKLELEVSKVSLMYSAPFCQIDGFNKKYYKQVVKDDDWRGWHVDPKATGDYDYLLDTNQSEHGLEAFFSRSPLSQNAMKLDKSGGQKDFVSFITGFDCLKPRLMGQLVDKISLSCFSEKQNDKLVSDCSPSMYFFSDSDGTYNIDHMWFTFEKDKDDINVGGKLRLEVKDFDVWSIDDFGIKAFFGVYDSKNKQKLDTIEFVCPGAGPHHFHHDRFINNHFFLSAHSESSLKNILNNYQQTDLYSAIENGNVYINLDSLILNSGKYNIF